MRRPVLTRRAALVSSAVLTAAAVAAALLLSVAGIATAAGSSATGAKTAPPSGPVVTPVAAALVPGPVKVIRRGESNVLTARLDFQPGASTGWHYHPGPVFVQVVAGAVTLSHAAHGRCLSQVVPAGQGFFEQPGAVHVADNRGKEPGGRLRHLRPSAGGTTVRGHPNARALRLSIGLESPQDPMDPSSRKGSIGAARCAQLSPPRSARPPEFCQFSERWRALHELESTAAASSASGSSTGMLLTAVPGIPTFRWRTRRSPVA